jgi:DNA-binding IclR family transcriptional regulator
MKNHTRATISIPKALRERMDQANEQAPRLNWSRIASGAIEAALSTADTDEGTVTISARIWKMTQERLAQLETMLANVRKAVS